MLPVVIIGADATVLEAFQEWRERHAVLDYPDAERADFGLLDQHAEEVEPRVGQDGEGRWECNVVYAGLALGIANTGNAERLAHTGWTIVADRDIDDDPGASRRVVEGSPQGKAPSMSVWQAAAVLGAHLVVDVANADGMATVERQLSNRPTP